MRYEDHLAVLAPEITRFASVVRGMDMTAPVPGCPEWNLAALIEHTGHVHRWVTHILATGAQAPVPWTSVEYDKPEDPDELPAWLGAGGPPLLAELGKDPDAPVWGFGGNDRRWWVRRMLHETSVHRADAELTLGLEPVRDPDVAVDGVDEFLHLVEVVMARREQAGNLTGSGESLHLHAVDAPGEWTITLGADAMSWERGHSKATTAVRGCATDLLLLMYNRRHATDVERFETFGDLGVAERWSANTKI
jgi:uncharacterized protein (TIGR03083 family)